MLIMFLTTSMFHINIWSKYLLWNLICTMVKVIYISKSKTTNLFFHLKQVGTIFSLILDMSFTHHLNVKQLFPLFILAKPNFL